MDPHLEPAVELLEELMNAERFTRERIGLAATRTIPHPSWITYASTPFTIPIISPSDTSDDGILLFEYFVRALPFARNEPTAVGFLDDPRGAPDPLRAYAEAGAGARRRYDVERAVRSIDVTRLVEQFLHDTSPYGRSVFEAYEAYRDAKRTCSNGTLEAHVGLAIDLGEEIIASNAIRFERLNVIGTHLGQEAIVAPSTSPAQAIMIDIAQMIGCPILRTPTDLAIPDDNHILLEAIDRFSQADARYASAARTALLKTLECDPGLIAHADAYARTPSSWIQTIS